MSRNSKDLDNFINYSEFLETSQTNFQEIQQSFVNLNIRLKRQERKIEDLETRLEQLERQEGNKKFKLEDVMMDEKIN